MPENIYCRLIDDNNEYRLWTRDSDVEIPTKLFTALVKSGGAILVAIYAGIVKLMISGEGEFTASKVAKLLCIENKIADVNLLKLVQMDILFVADYNTDDIK